MELKELQLVIAMQDEVDGLTLPEVTSNGSHSCHFVSV
jgi:hypothetical protein